MSPAPAQSIAPAGPPGSTGHGSGATPSDAAERWVPRPWASALAGIAAAAAGLGAAELVASLRPTWPSPVISIGTQVVDRVPQPVKQFAIDTFGTADKAVLLAGIVVVVALAAAGIGILARTRRTAAVVATVALAGVAGLAAVAGSTTTALALVPAIVSALIAVPLLLAMTPRPDGHPSRALGATVPPGGPQPPTDAPERNDPRVLGATVPPGGPQAPTDAPERNDARVLGATVPPGGPRPPTVVDGPGTADVSDGADGPDRAEATDGPEASGGPGGPAGPEAPTAPDGPGATPDPDVAGLGTIPRRRFLALAGGSLAFGVAALGGGQWVQRRRALTSRAAAPELPTPSTAAPSIPATAHPEVSGLSPFVTPNADFYRIDTALTVPRLAADGWTLRIHGMVDNEVTFSYEELLAMDSVDIPITLTCVSNEVGGGLVGTARWQGVRLADLLDRAGVADSATQLVGRAHDGWTAGFPTEAAFDRDTLVAWGMNGEPLPAEHGFPLRLVTPGLYGYVSATKWLTDIEATTFDAFDQYWVERGWVEDAPIKVASRIDTPSGLATVERGTVAVAGVAWAQTRGISAVEVQVDDGEFQAADLATEVSADTWRQWVFPWDTTDLDAGRHQLTVRATDGDGVVQSEERQPPFPSGATGWHSLAVMVSST